MNDGRQASDIEWLKRIPLPAHEAMFQRATPHRYGPADVIFTPSEHPDSVFLLEQGLARIYRLDASGSQATFGFILPGEVFGELIAFGDYGRDSFAEAMQSSKAWKIPRQVFQTAISTNPLLVLEIVRQIITRFKRMEDRVEDLVFRSVRGRVIHVLLQLAGDIGRHDKVGVNLNVGLTQADLATIVGATRQTVNLCLQRLEHDGLVHLGSRSVCLRRPDQLAQQLADERMSAI